MKPHLLLHAVCTGLLLALSLGTARAEAPLTLEAVLEAVDARIPQLSAAAAKQALAEAEAMAARGAFDPKLAAKTSAEVVGYYERQTLDTYLAGTTPLGLEYTLGYMRGTGDFPVYYGAYETLDGGELRAGLAMPLLRGLGMTPERAKLLATQAKIDLAGADLAEKRRLIRLKAALSYLKWAKAGESYRLAGELLQLAQARTGAIERSVAAGGMARLDLVDNQRVVFERQGAVTAAEQDLAVTAAELSLWYRDADGQPRVVDAAVLPPPPELPAPSPRSPAEDAARAWAARPDLLAMGALLEQALIEARAARAQRLPELYVSGIVSQDYGNGSSSRAPTELDVAALLEAPILNRKARGRLDAAQAEVERLEAERRGLQDAIAAELAARSADVDATWARLTLAEQSLQAAREVATLERRNFELGAGDLFRLVKREEAVAKDAKEVIEARFAYRAAVVAYRAAVGVEP